ncbi:MAG: HAD family hydrolase [Lachnospiraceae bacterium]|nr:HAD family hydrolase [Lachnospiraceae bacterium]
MLKAVIFDIDNTFYSYDRANEKARAAIAAYAAENLGMTAEEFNADYNRVFDELMEYIGEKAASHNRLIRLKTILEQRSLPLHPHAMNLYNLYWDTVIDSAESYDGYLEALDYIRSKGLKIGIGTNMTARIQFLKLEKLKVLPYVDFFICSEEVGEEKPSRKLFERCVEKAGCRAEECLFIGDSLKHDIIPSLKLGMKALWFDPEGAGTEGYESFKDYRELPGIIGRLAQE